MIRRILLAVCLMCLMVPRTYAVLKERDLNHTLMVLQAELEAYHKDLAIMREASKEQRKQLRTMLTNYLEEANQISLMVYSQQQDYVFDITYACHQATELYRRFHSNQIPFDTLRAQLNIEVQRYRGLRTVLNDIMPDTLDATKLKSRAVCINLANAIHSELLQQQQELNKYEEQYNQVARQLNDLSLYARERYRDIQTGILSSRGDGYLSLLRNFYKNAYKSSTTLSQKYSNSGNVESQWRGTIVWMVFAIMFVYGLLAAVAGFLVWRFALPRFKHLRSQFDNPTNAILCFAMSTFAIVVGVLNQVVDHNFIRLATGLLVQYAWLVTAIQLGLIIRLEGEEEKAGLRTYAPILATGFIVIVMRIVFIPNAVIAFYFPPLLIVTTLWQWRAIRRCGKQLPKSDQLYTWITLAVMVSSIVLSCVGRTLMAVELFIWWMMQLTCIQSITCLYDLLDRYERKAIAKGATIRRTWFIDLINKALLPIAGIASFLFSIYWSADVFDMSDWVLGAFMTTIVNVDGVISLSLWRICTVAALFYITRYVMYFVRENLVIHYSNPRFPNGRGAIVIGNNIASIVVWGGYLIVSMLLLHIGNSWILVITGGLSTGIGFAMKDTLENFFYGVSLMLGRLHIGDVIECDGVRGTVSNISYQSTTIQAVDGAEMAFLNSQLFSKNFKNMTRNHNLELVIIPVGVAYGTDVEQVRRILTEEIDKLDCFNREKGVTVGFMDFGASSVDLKVCLWVDVMTKGSSVAAVKEVIYNTLNRHSIEIPFPQLDVHQR